MNRGMKVMADRLHFYQRGVRLLIAQDMDAGRMAVATQVVMTEVNEGELPPTSGEISLSEPAAQQLMDDLWRLGIRPGNGTGNEGQLAATVNHLNDMRQLATKFSDAVLQRAAANEGPTPSRVLPETSSHGYETSAKSR